MAFSELAGRDGKIAATLRVLLLQPGRLTTELLEGRGAGYVSPMALFIACSVVYFLLAAALPTEKNAGDMNLGLAKAGLVDSSSGGSNASTEEDQLLTQLEEQVAIPPVLQPMMHRMAKNPEGFQRDLFGAVPKIMFVLLPAFAAIVAVFYRGRRFSDHMYFALHIHAQLFVALAVAALAGFMHSSAIDVLVGIAVLVWVPVYWHQALQRVYGGSHGATMAKELGISALYAVLTIPPLAAVALWVAGR